MTTENNVLALAEARGGDAKYAYAFGFVWAMLTPEQKETLDRYALEILEKEGN